ncbi:MAG: hypothetical protein AAGI34_17010 [Pseudomonadota bacterium]
MFTLMLARLANSALDMPSIARAALSWSLVIISVNLSPFPLDAISKTVKYSQIRPRKRCNASEALTETDPWEIDMAVPTHMPRRGVLKAIPAAAAALAVPAFAEPNPDADIFALHAEWREARADWLRWVEFCSRLPCDAEGAYQQQHIAAFERQRDALTSLVAAQPATLAGLQAQAEAVRAADVDAQDDDPQLRRLLMLFDSIAGLPTAA